MYQRFTVSDVTVQEAENTVILSFTYDLNVDTVHARSVYVTESKQKTQPLIETEMSVNGSEVWIVFKDDMKVNTEYEIHVKKEVLSVIDDRLDIEFVKSFSIPSIVDSHVRILSPADYEDFDGIVPVSLEEKAGKSSKLFNSFTIQIASDVSFFDVILKTDVQDRNSIQLSQLKPAKQYFMRARAQDGSKAHGNWSRPVTFTFHTKVSSDTDDEDNEVIFEKDLKILSRPENGVTPCGCSFIIEFDEELDPDSFEAKDLYLYRKQV